MADRQFTAAKAEKELRAYRQGRLGPTTRLLRNAVVDAALNHGSLLDLGAGVGSLTFELLERGMDAATVVDASAAYVAAAGDEAQRHGRADAITIIRGDIVEIADSLPVATLVTLDRVVCCYQAFEPLLAKAVRHAEKGFALSYPRDRWFVRASMSLENARRARKTGFRTFVHPPPLMGRVIEREGFVLRVRRTTLMWAVEVFTRGVPSPRRIAQE